MPTCFSSQPLGDEFSVGSSNILPHSLLLLVALSAVFFFFLCMHGYYWNPAKEHSGALLCNCRAGKSQGPFKVHFS